MGFYVSRLNLTVPVFSFDVSAFGTYSITLTDGWDMSLTPVVVASTLLDIGTLYLCLWIQTFHRDQS